MNKTKVYVTTTDILDNHMLYEKAYNSLDIRRKEKTERLKFQKDKNHCVASGVLLNYALKKEGLSNFEILCTPNGKPYVKNEKNICFNLSHSHGVVMCAVADCEIGCDVEKIFENRIDVAKHYFADDEYKTIMQFDNIQDRDKAFCRIWTLKESFIKATGLGMKLGFASFSIDISVNPPGIIQMVNDKKYYFEEFDFLDGYNFAICSEKPLLCHVEFADIHKII